MLIDIHDGDANSSVKKVAFLVQVLLNSIGTLVVISHK